MMYRRFVSCLLGVGCLFAVVGVTPVLASVPVWHVTSMLAPARIAPGGSGQLIVTVTNLGDAPVEASSAEPIRLGVELPTGVTVSEMAEDAPQSEFGFPRASAILSCEPAALTCETESGTVPSYGSVMVTLRVSVPANAGAGLTAKLSVSGGRASPVSVREPFRVGSGPVGFGVERLEVMPLNEDGSVATQAGSHPFQYTTTFSLNEELLGRGEPVFRQEGPAPPALPKEVRFNLPPGVVGNPTAIPQCTIHQFQTIDPSTSLTECPADTAIGVAAVDLSNALAADRKLGRQPFRLTVPLYNLTPSVGEPARFGFLIPASVTSEVPVILDTAVRTGGDYGVVVSAHNISQNVSFLGSQVSFWGVPGDPRHDSARGVCVFFADCAESAHSPQTPLLTLPTSCAGLSSPLTTIVEAASWAAPSLFTAASEGEYRLSDALGDPLALDGCNRLRFDPSISVAPDGHAASTPTGLNVAIHVPQQDALNPTGLSQANLRDITVALPPGVAVNPAGSDGLQACSEGLSGFAGLSGALNP
ncbi:MAG TPA: hypothetical protein VK537_06510, partial [Galbitalea sp.]|nr:hypothetical protein [Galbitalea sp.]